MSEVSGDVLYESLKSHCVDRFRDNWAIATIVYLAAASRSHSVGIVGPSGSGKSTLVDAVLELLPPRGVIRASRVTAAALMTMSDVKVIVRDEIISDSAFDRIRRLLITTGRADVIVADGAGNRRKLHLGGPIAFIDCQLNDDPRDFQDASRAIVLSMSECEHQYHFHATQRANASTLQGQAKADEYQSFIHFWKKHVQWNDDEAKPILDIDVTRLVPPYVGSHTSRRIEHVIKLAEAVARLRANSNSPCCIHVVEEDVTEALNLLTHARALDDHVTLSQAEREFLGQLAAMMGYIDSHGQLIEEVSRRKLFNIQSIVSRFNTPRYVSICRQIAHQEKRHPRDGRIERHLTRAIVTRLLNRLHDNNLVAYKKVHRSKYWKITKDGLAYLQCGGLNAFRLIQRQMESTRQSNSGT